MDKLLYTFFIITVIALFIGTMGLIGQQVNSNKINDIEIPEEGFDWRTDKEFWKFVNDNYISEQELNKTKDDIKEKFDLFQTEIVKIKNDIRNKFPQASTVEQEGQTAISETPFLTLTMEKTEWLLGDTLVFTGTAHPSDLLSITVKLPDRTLLTGSALPGEIVNGMYRIEIATNFDHTPGTWTVFAKQGKEQSKTLFFTVE